MKAENNSLQEKPENSWINTKTVWETLSFLLFFGLYLVKIVKESHILKSGAVNYEINHPEISPVVAAVAQRVATSLAWASYGAVVVVSQAASLPASTLNVYPKSYQHATGFNDRLNQPYQQAKQEKEINLKSYPIEPDMVTIKPGIFLMGSDDGDPRHEVTIAYPFEIGKTEVTFAEYDRFAEATGREKPDDNTWGRDKQPVINVSFTDAQAYVRWLSQQTGKAYRLPTEAEWEYVARAGSTTDYWWGNEIGENRANCINCGSKWENIRWDKRQTAPVGSFKANAFGLYDTAGNVIEWTQDCWHDNYVKAPADGTAWLEQDGGHCDLRVVRGGSLLSVPMNVRSASRLRFNTEEVKYGLGFRVARAL